MEYVVLREEKTGKVIKLGRFGDNFSQEKFHQGEWVWDDVLDRQLFDGWLEEISEAEAKRLIALQFRQEKIAA